MAESKRLGAPYELVVEVAQVETRAQGLLRAPPQLLDLQLPQLVGQRLTRPGDVAVDLGLDLVVGQGETVPGPGVVSGSVVSRSVGSPAASNLSVATLSVVGPTAPGRSLLVLLVVLAILTLFAASAFVPKAVLETP
jgi:hypothetical protein